MSSPEPFESATLSTLDQVRRIVESVLGLVVPDADDNLIGLGANSMELVRIINLIEDGMGLRLRFEEVSFEPSITALVKNVQAAREHQAQPMSESGPETHRPVVPDQAVHQDPVTVTGVRNDNDWPAVSLAVSTPSDDAKGASVRTFGPQVLELSAIAHLLDALGHPTRGASGQVGYASAGGLYPVQTYLYVKAGRVQGLQCGLYYFHPGRRELWLLVPDLVLGESLYEPVLNAPLYRAAAFALFLVSRPASIEPSYAGRSHDYCLLEAGAMAQLLRMRAPSCGIGLCAIGDVAFESVRNWFELDDDQACLHSLVGGGAP